MKAIKIAITGIGGICAAGDNLTTSLHSFQDKKRNAGRLTLFNSNLPYPVFEVKNIPKKFQRKDNRTLSLALCATNEALSDAKILHNISDFKIGVSLGTTIASQFNDFQFYTRYRKSGKGPLTAINRFLKGNLSENIAHTYNLHGPCVTIVNACSSGTDAIGVAMSWLQNGTCDIAIAGGADEMNRIPFDGFASLGILSESLCAPFDRDRSGLNLGEGSGILILEREDICIKRGKKPLLYILGYGAASDAYHLTAPRPDGSGLETAIWEALKYANITPRDVCFVNAHGTGTRDNDRVEGIVISKIFEPSIKFFSTKGYTGHTLGAAGGLEAAFTALALKKGWIPQSAGFVQQDKEIPITPIKEACPIYGNYAISTSLAFGGNNAAIVIACLKNRNL